MRKGFTLVEIMIAVTVLGLAMAGAYRIINMSTQARLDAHNFYIATVIANNRIERAKNMLYTDLPLMAEATNRVDEVGAPNPQGQYRRFTEVESDWDGDPRVTRVAVSVITPPTLRVPTNRTARITVSTLLTEYLE